MNIAVTDNRKARVRYDDLGEWITEADKLGELVRANGYLCVPKTLSALIR
jgi:hypothetical protein